MGVPAERVLLAEDGDVVELTDGGIDFVGEVPAGYLYVDGIVGDVGRGVLRDRRVLAEEGVVVVVVTVDAKSGEVLTGPEIITRGWVYAPEAEELLEEARLAVLAALEEARRLRVGRLRDPPPAGPFGPRALRLGADPAPAHDRPGGHGGLSEVAGGRVAGGGAGRVRRWVPPRSATVWPHRSW